MKQTTLYHQLFIVLILFCLVGDSYGQKKKFVFPKPIKDSVWYETYSDTLFGTIEVNISGGKMIADGIIVSSTTMHYSKPIYSVKGQAAIDSFYKSQEATSWQILNMSSGGWIGWSNQPERKTAYIKTSNGYKRVDNDFIFKPL